MPARKHTRSNSSKNQSKTAAAAPAARPSKQGRNRAVIAAAVVAVLWLSSNDRPAEGGAGDGRPSAAVEV